MVWIRIKNFSREVFHHTRWKLNWNNPTYDLLGIKFSVTLDKMSSLNDEHKLSEIKDANPIPFEQIYRATKRVIVTNIETLIYVTITKTQ